MTTLTTEQLRTLAPPTLARLLPATVWIDGCGAVILRTADDDMVEVCLGDDLTAFSTKVLDVQPMTDAERSAEILGTAAAVLALARRTALDENAELVRTHTTTLAEIRRYAIERHEADDICRSGLDRFLGRFDLRPYSPRLRVDFVIMGSYETSADSGATAEYAARVSLRPDLSAVESADQDTLKYDVRVSDTERVDFDGS